MKHDVETQCRYGTMHKLYHWYNSTKQSSTDELNYIFAWLREKRKRRATSHRNAIYVGRGQFYITSGNHLEVLCEFPIDGRLLLNIVWARNTNLRFDRRHNYDRYALQRKGVQIVRLSYAKSLLVIKHYQPREDDGLYRCYAQKSIEPYYDDNCNRRQSQAPRHAWCNDGGGRGYKRNVETVFMETDVYGRPPRQSAGGIIYDNVGYGYNDHTYDAHNGHYHPYNRNNANRKRYYDNFPKITFGLK